MLTAIYKHISIDYFSARVIEAAKLITETLIKNKKQRLNVKLDECFFYLVTIKCHYILSLGTSV